MDKNGLNSNWAIIKCYSIKLNWKNQNQNPDPVNYINRFKKSRRKVVFSHKLNKNKNKTFPIFLKTNSYSGIVSDPNVIKNCVFEIHKFHVNCSQSKTTSESWSLFSLLFWNLHEKLHTSQLRKLVVLQGRLDRSRFGATPWGLCFSFFFSSNIKILWKTNKQTNKQTNIYI